MERLNDLFFFFFFFKNFFLTCRKKKKSSPISVIFGFLEELGEGEHFWSENFSNFFHHIWWCPQYKKNFMSPEGKITIKVMKKIRKIFGQKVLPFTQLLEKSKNHRNRRTFFFFFLTCQFFFYKKKKKNYIEPSIHIRSQFCNKVYFFAKKNLVVFGCF